MADFVDDCSRYLVSGESGKVFGVKLNDAIDNAILFVGSVCPSNGSTVGSKNTQPDHDRGIRDDEPVPEVARDPRSSLDLAIEIRDNLVGDQGGGGLNLKNIECMP